MGAQQRTEPRVGHWLGLSGHDRQSRQQPPREPSGCAFGSPDAVLKLSLRSASVINREVVEKTSAKSVGFLNQAKKRVILLASSRWNLQLTLYC